MKKVFVLALGCLALALVAAGCGGDDNGDSGGSGDSQPAETAAETPPAETAAEAPPAGAAKGTVEVSMKDIAFNPETVTVKKGGTVKWTNDDSVGHDVTKENGPGPDFSSGDAGGLGEGDTFEQTFDAAGTIAYECTVHPGMTGTITVK